MSAQSRSELRTTLGIALILAVIIVFFVGLFLAASTRAQNMELRLTPTPSPAIDTKNLHITSKADVVTTNVTISCGDKGSIIISMKTGKVQYQGDCTPDEGAKAFWMAIERMYRPCPNK